MFRILFFICFITLLFFGFFNIFSPLSTGVRDKTNTEFEILLMTALEKYTSPEELTEVIIFPELILGEDSSANKNISSKKGYFNESEFNKKQQELNSFYDNSSGNTPNVSLPQSNLSTLDSLSSTDIAGGELAFSNSATCDGGILYDPCIDPLDPFLIGDEERMYLGITPIYRYPNEMRF